MFKRILVGFDGSEPAENALKLACRLAGQSAGELHVSHTPLIETATVAMAAMGGYHAVAVTPAQHDIDEAGEKIIAKAQAICAETGGSSPRIHKGEVDPAANILAVAEEIDADLIVTGRRGLGSVSALLLGSTAAKVAQKAGCACLSVP